MPLVIFVIIFVILLIALMMGLAGQIPMPGASPVAFAQADIARSWAAAEIDMTVNRHVLIMDSARKAAEVEAAAKIAQANADAQAQIVWAQTSAQIWTIVVIGVVTLLVIGALIVMMRQAAQARAMIEAAKSSGRMVYDGDYQLQDGRWIVRKQFEEMEHRR